MVFKNLPYDPIKDFRWAGGIFEGTGVLVVSGGSPHASVADLIASAKARPGKLNYGTYVSAYRLSTEWLNQVAGIQTSPVGYKGAPQMTTDIIGGQLDFAFVDIVAIAPLVKSGRLRALAVTSEKRHGLLPAVPTLVEAGLPQYGKSAWLGVAVRASTPDAIVAKISAALQKVHAQEDTQKFATEQGASLMPFDGAQMTRFYTEEIEKYRRIAAVAKIELE